MAVKTVQDASLTAIANAIRAKGETVALLEFPSGFVTAIEDLPTGSGAIEIVDTVDSHGGTIRTITAVDITETDFYIDYQSAMVALGVTNA